VAPIETLPDGCFIRLGDQPFLVHGRHLLPWTFDGYGSPQRRPQDASATVLTPRSLVAALIAGYRPLLHPSARRGD
jgi:hypothetical protein